MENASKALLIAGAVLVVILLIGVGMLIYQSSMGTINEAVAQMSSQEKDMFNAQFQQYEGPRVNGSNVKALINKIKNNNVTNPEGEPKYVKISGITETAKVNSAKSYNVTCTDSNNDGLIDTVTIADASTGTTK